MTMYTTVTVPAKRYENHDDCLGAAEDDYALEHDLAAWQVSASWASETSREEIDLRVPLSAAAHDLVRASEILDGTGTLYTVCEQALRDGEGTPERVREIWAESSAESSDERGGS